VAAASCCETDVQLVIIAEDRRIIGFSCAGRMASVGPFRPVPKRLALYVQYSILAISHIRSNFWAQTIGTGTDTAAVLQASPLPLNQSEDAHRNIS